MDKNGPQEPLRVFENKANSITTTTPVHQQLEYPIPWRALGGRLVSAIASHVRNEWQQRTRWGKAKLLVLAPLFIVASLLVGTVLLAYAIAYELSILLIPVIDLWVRVGRHLPDLPATYKEDT